MNKRKYVIQVMGMKSFKYGGFERFMIQLAQELNKENIGLVLVYNELPTSEVYLTEIAKKSIVLELADTKKPIMLFVKLLKIRLKYKSLIIHSHFEAFYPSIIGYILKFKLRVISLHMMLRGFDNKEITSRAELGKKHKLNIFVYRTMNTQILAVSKAVKNQYIQLFPKSRKNVEVFYLGVESNPYSRIIVRDQLGLNEEDIAICCIAFAQPIKGVDILIKAISGLKEKYRNNFKVYLIGLDERIKFTKILKENVISLGIENNVDFIGIIDNATEYLAGMDFYCQPSRSEALPNTIMEAGMASLPTVASNVGGIPEVVIDGKTGFLFEKDNSDDLAKKLKILIDDEDRRLQFGKLARKNMEDNFNREKQIKDLVEKYKSYI